MTYFASKKRPKSARQLRDEQLMPVIEQAHAGIGAAASVGSVADGYDNAMAEALNGTFKAELAEMQGPWWDVDQVGRAIFRWVARCNEGRLHSA